MALFNFFNKNKFSVSHSLILHFLYHKAMTVFFSSVFRTISQKFNIYHTFYHSVTLNGIQEDIFQREEPRIISLSHSNGAIDITNAPSYKGTHLIRDPRDLLVSGYRYHKYCTEDWALKPFNEATIKYFGIKELGLEKIAAKVNTYQQLINHLDIETGYLLELNLRKTSFDIMFHWNYENPNMMELRYENVFGNENEMFAKIFKHYGFNKAYTDYGLKMVENYNFKNLSAKGKTGNNKHANTGIAGQWKENLPPSIIEKFNQEFGELLKKLNY